MKTAFLIALAGALFGVGGFRAVRAPQPIPVVAPVHTSAASEQAFILPNLPVTYLPTRDFNITDPTINARAAMLVDGTSNRTLFALHADQKLPIASITKLMTAMVVLKTVPAAEIFTVTAEDLNVDGLGSDFVQTDQFTRDELLKLMLVKSSNDAASLFAAHAYQQGVDFIAMMNREAAALGMTGTHFSDPAGLDDRETYSTAADVVILARAALGYPLIREITLLQRADVATLGGTRYHITSTDELLNVIPSIMLGKTGRTPGALGTMALAVGVDKTNYLISVVLGAEDRFGETQKLITWGKAAHRWK